MSTARSADAETAPAAVAAALADAPFVRVVARADGDSLAASGILARALRSADVPFHVQLRANPESVVDDDADDRGDTVVSVGATATRLAVPGDESPATLAAYRVASELGDAPDATLALAGVVAGEASLGDDEYDPIRSAAEAGGVTRRPGVGVPVADLADGLAHSTLLHAPYSGDVESARAALAEANLPAELDADAHRRVASLAALDATETDNATPRAVESLERLLRPYETPNGPFETVEGYADVLCAVARERPGTGVAFALGHATDATQTAALDAWRNHALEAHTVLREADTARFADCVVVRTGLGSDSLGVLSTIARLVRDFRSPEPVVLAVGDGAAAAASVEPRALGSTMATAAAEVGGTGYGRKDAGEARFDAEETDATTTPDASTTDQHPFTAAFREALRA
ncbi:exonuclease RecJ [Haloprofundus salilacus]|uniref:exonuclease RecJ n=1 Tax=Haloprofundus salilacus TaxID=2876190 RepID=UPI001CCE66FE|nr:exonuclease RecJ [Haloprofundus salilacus]